MVRGLARIAGDAGAVVHQRVAPEQAVAVHGHARAGGAALFGLPMGAEQGRVRRARQIPSPVRLQGGGGRGCKRLSKKTFPKDNVCWENIFCWEKLVCWGRNLVSNFLFEKIIF